MFAKFSPDASRVAYVRANDLYVEHLNNGRIVRLTRDGSETTINGTSDWVNEEELVFRARDGHVKEAPLLLEPFCGARGADVRKTVLDQADPQRLESASRFLARMEGIWRRLFHLAF